MTVTTLDADSAPGHEERYAHAESFITPVVGEAGPSPALTRNRRPVPISAGQASRSTWHDAS